MGDDNYTYEIRQGKKNNTGADEIFKMQMAVTAVNTHNGWFDKERSFGEDIALLHSEVSEALEAFRKHSTDDRTKIDCALKEFNGDYDAHDRVIANNAGHLCKPEGVGSEFADILVRLLDSCERYNVDLVTEFWRKVEYNATRGYRHGNRAL